MDAIKVLEDLKRRFPNEPEYHQAVEEVLATIEAPVFLLCPVTSNCKNKALFL